MRLIDADELKKAIIHHLGIRSEENLLESERSIYNLIDGQTTVERLKEQQQKGHWIDDGDPCAWVCSVCGYRVARHNNTPFCPKCGADMRGEQE